MFLLAACTTPKIEPPEQTNLNVRMAVEGADKFEHYIQSLTIYAFRRTADQTYVYDSTMAVLDSAGSGGYAPGAVFSGRRNRDGTGGGNPQPGIRGRRGVLPV